MNNGTQNLVYGSNGVNPVAIVATFAGNMLICRNGSLPAAPQSAVTYSWTPYTYFGVNLNATRPGYKIGDILWWNTIQPPASNVTVEQGLADPTANGGTGVFVESYKETMQWIGYSMANGAKLWGPTPSQVALDYYGAPYYPFLAGQLAYGKLYSAEYGGIVYCYDLTNGNLLWTFGNGGAGNDTTSGFEVPGNYPLFINGVGNGVVYIATTEHTPETPIYKGALVYAINATDGTQIWTLNSYIGEFSAMSFVMADGYATWFNGYDNSSYSVGRGPSQTTVDAPKIGVDLGKSIVISGTVTDISAGTTQPAIAARFPNGVSCASDANMANSMGYVYPQKPLPDHFAGVNVTISVIDANHIQRPIGTAITDAQLAHSPSNGYLTFQVRTLSPQPSPAPMVTGQATQKSSFAVDSAHPTLAPTATPTQSAADLYFVPAIAGLFVLIIIVAIVLALLMLRKHP
jgi:outer membrane protein assembly factor BamB